MFESTTYQISSRKIKMLARTQILKYISTSSLGKNPAKQNQINLNLNRTLNRKEKNSPEISGRKSTMIFPFSVSQFALLHFFLYFTCIYLDPLHCVSLRFSSRFSSFPICFSEFCLSPLCSHSGLLKIKNSNKKLRGHMI